MRTATESARELLDGVVSRGFVHADELSVVQTAVLASVAEQLEVVGALLERITFPETTIIGRDARDADVA